MPTEIIAESRQKALVAEASRIQGKNKVIEADRTVARQELSLNEQTLPSTKDSSQPSNKELEQVTDNLNQHVQSLKRDLHFSVDEETGDTVIRVIDSESQKTIRTIPSEEFVSVSQQLNQTVGLLLNAEA